MTRLILAEARRWRARRGVWVSAGIGVLLALLIGLGLMMGTRPPSGQDIEMGRQAYADIKADWDAHHAERLASCLQEPGMDDAKCQQMDPEPKESDFIPLPLTFAGVLQAASGMGAYLGAFLALVAAATFWGAEYRHGSLATWLTFAPDRLRVWGAKFCVLVVGGVLLTLVVEGVLIGMGAASILAWQGPSGFAAMGAAGQGSISVAEGWAMAGRGLGLGAFGAVFGGALAVLFRQTIAPILIPVGYLLFAGVFGLLVFAQPNLANIALLLPENNLAAYLNGGTTIYVPVQTVTPQGLQTESSEQLIPFGQGLAYMLVAAAVLLVVSAWSFRRRDVA